MAEIKITTSAVDAAQPRRSPSVASFMRYVHTEDGPVRQAAEPVANRHKSVVEAQRNKALAE